jgi:hypothetical protein
MKISASRVLPFTAGGAEWGEAGPPRVGRLHRDGSITYRGETYPTIKQVPADCLAIRPDQDTLKQWTRLYRAVRPDTGRTRPLHLRGVP